MQTAIFQSYRTFDVPPILERCMSSVRAWSEKQGFEYRFFDDVLFEKIPDWFKERVAFDKLPMSDLGRLVIAKELLAEGIDRVVWVDADAFVLNPEKFLIPDEPFFVCKEVWVEPSPAGRPAAIHKVNNAVMGFTREQAILEFLIDTCIRHARNVRGPIPKIEFGPNLLTTLDRFVHFPQVKNVALVSPLVILDALKGGGPYWSAYLHEFGVSMDAINLCSSYLREKVQGIQITEEHFDKLIGKLKDDPELRKIPSSFHGRRRPSGTQF